jgi:hypothetical protein
MKRKKKKSQSFDVEFIDSDLDWEDSISGKGDTGTLNARSVSNAA